MEGTRTEVWLRALVDGMPQMIWRAVDHGSWTWSSPQWHRYTGQTGRLSLGDGWLEMVHPEDRAAARAAWASVTPDAEFGVDLRIRDRAGAHRWFQTRALPVRGEDGSVIEWIGTSIDVDDLRRLQSEQRVLVAELQHRTLNLLAVVHAVASQTIEHSSSLDDFQDRFDDRLSALSRVQGLLSESEREPITIGRLVELELSALAGSRGDRIKLDGLDVPIRNTAVQTLALAIHELSTNALRYGALSAPEGALAVSWFEHLHEGERKLCVTWMESGVPRRSERRSDRVGYRRILLEQVLPEQLDASTSLTFTDDGLRCSVDLPYRHYGIGPTDG